MELDIIKEAGAYAGAIAAVIALAALLAKPVRKKLSDTVSRISGKDELSGKIDRLMESCERQFSRLGSMARTTIEQNDELKKEMSLQSEALKADLRNSILELYYECTEKNSITAYERQNVSELYENYKALGGNSFVKDCVDSIRKLPTEGSHQ